MINEKKIVLTILCHILLISLSLAQITSTEVFSPDAVLVEFDDSFITNKDLHDRINSLPTAQRHHFRTVAGQERMLETMITDHVLYQRAIDLGIDQLSSVQKEIFTNARPVTHQIYIREAYRKALDFNPTTIEIHFHDNIDFNRPVPRAMVQHIPLQQDNVHYREDSTNIVSIEKNGNIRYEGPFESETKIHFFRKTDFDIALTKSFEELKNEIELALIRQRRQELYLSQMEYLSEKYNVSINEELLKHVGIGIAWYQGLVDNSYTTVSSITAPDHLRDNIAISSSHPEINMTLGDIENILRDAASKDLILNEFDTPKIREAFVLTELDERLLNAITAEEKIFENSQDMIEIKLIKQDVVIDFFKDREINSKIEITNDDLYEFYLANPEEHTLIERRYIRHFVARDNRSAKRHHREISRMLKRNQQDMIPEYILRESFMGYNGGLLWLETGTRVMPTVGPDQNYINKIFEAKEGQLSNVFQNINGYFAFFYLVEILPERLVPFAEITHKHVEPFHELRSNELVNQIQTELRDRYNVVTHFDRITSAITTLELLNQAELARNRGQIDESISLLDVVISEYPETEDAYEAMFIKGFIKAEDLESYDLAIETFQEMIERFPNGEMNRYANEMIQSIKQR